MLTVKNLSKSFKQPLFEPLSFELKKGEVLQVVGPNGSGKTTLLKCIAKTLSCTYSELTFDSENLTPQDSAYATNDERSFFPKLSLQENLSFFSKFYQSDISVEPLIALFELEKHWESEFQICSTGIRKRLGLIRAIVKNTPILLLDEPFSNIDPESKIKIQNIFFNSEIRQNKITIFSSNNPLSDEAIVQSLSIKPKGSR